MDIFKLHEIKKKELPELDDEFAKEASELACPDSDGEEICDLIDKEFPIESALVPPLVELVVKELRGPEYSPKDEENNAKDDLSEVTVK